MVHKVEVEQLDAVRRRVAVEVPAEEVAVELERAYEALRREARVPGFRPGRVPPAVLERLFGDRVRAEVFERLTRRSLVEAIEAQRLEALGVPEIVTEQAAPGAALRYRATIEVMPEVEVRGYEGLELERPLVSVGDAEVETALERLRESFAQLHPEPEDTPVARGHVVAIRYEARVDGRPVGGANERLIEIGASPFPEAFDEHLVGATAGSERAFDIAWEQGQGGPATAGKTMHFAVLVRAVFRKDVPPLDDEFAKDHGECGSVAELRARVRTQLEAEAVRAADEAVRSAAAERLLLGVDLPVPEALVRRRTAALVDEVWSEWEARRIRPQNERAARERLAAELASRARAEVKLGLVLDAIARQEGLAVSEEAVDAYVRELAGRVGGAAGDRLLAHARTEEGRRALRTRLLHAEVIDRVVERAHVRTVSRPNAIAGENRNE